MSTISVGSGVVSSGLTISAGETLDVLSGGTVSGIIVSGGYENVALGGVDSGSTVEAGGILDDYGSATSGVISSGGAVGVGSGGALTFATVLNGGTLNVYTSGNDANSFIFGGTENVFGGSAYSDYVSGGGQIGVIGGGTQNYVYIENGGTFNLRSGGILENGRLSAGGVLNSGIGQTNIGLQNQGGTINPLCFAAGTRIQAERGFVPVEDLVVGESVAAHFAGAAPIVWIGHRTIDCRRHARPEGVWPVRVRAGAFGEGMPLRDVLLSPDHAVFVGEVLVPVRELVDGGMIVQERVDSVTYYHVELAQHDVLFAEGLPAESYLDTGNRTNFQGEAGVIALHPEFAALAWDALGCAPLVLAGPELEAARRMVVRVDEPGWAQGIVATA
jgi:autotransporter passenger strand-loop-strand repeat protein